MSKSKSKKEEVVREALPSDPSAEKEPRETETIEAADVGEMPAAVLDAEENIEALNADGTALDQYDPGTLDHVASKSISAEEEPVVRSATDEEEAAEAELAASDPEPEGAAPNEPDPPEEQTGPQDQEGFVTKLSPAAFEKLTEVWKGRGNPHQFDYQGARWAVYDNGEKFIRTGGEGSMDKFYNSLSVG